ncbi:MAG: GDSL-type esterase/lipase family protein [Cyanobacteriota bacterium]|nr:GDSL-type esterase/lipase family protein [Cyanobacteriota bacterium]
MTLKNQIILLSFIVLFLSLIGSVALNFILFNAANSYYRQVNDTRLDPLGLDVYPSAENSPKQTSDRPTVVFFGDSRAASWPVPAQIDRFEFINRGIGAQTTAQVIQRYDRHVAPLNPDILVVQVGVNDLKTIPLFPKRKDEIIDRCKANIQTIIAEARQQNATIIISTIFPLGKLPVERQFFWSEEVDLAIKEVNEFIEGLAASDVLIFPTQPILAGDRAVVKDEYQFDFLHVNETGYEALNQQLVPLLQTIELEGKVEN